MSGVVSLDGGFWDVRRVRERDGWVVCGEEFAKLDGMTEFARGGGD